jgi:hypothetical protein
VLIGMKGDANLDWYQRFSRPSTRTANSGCSFPTFPHISSPFLVLHLAASVFVHLCCGSWDCGGFAAVLQRTGVAPRATCGPLNPLPWNRGLSFRNSFGNLMVVRSSSLCSGTADGTASSCKTQKEAHQPQLSVSTDGMASILVFRAASVLASACCRRSLGTLVEAMPSLTRSTSCATTGRLPAVNRFRGLEAAIFEAEEGQMFSVRSRSVWLCWMG